MLGVAIRIAQRMGLHSESSLARCTALEAELRRRLWWSLVLFDTRISEMAEHKISTLAPTWDCRIPLNVSDSDLRPEMKELPVVQEKSTDALFAVVRSELGDFVRHTMFHLDFTNPALKSIVGDVPEVATFEKIIDDKYLKFCDAEIPLHFMTIWWTRSYLAKCRLLEHHSRYSNQSVPQTDAQRDAIISIAIRMLECDTKLRSSVLTKPFRWLIHLHFPAPGYIQIVQDLRSRPGCEIADQAWEAMSDNFDTLFVFVKEDSESPLFRIFTKMILQAWEAREAASSEPLMPPRIVSSIRHRLAQIDQKAQAVDVQQPDDVMPGNFAMPMPLLMDPLPHGSPYNISARGGYGEVGPKTYSNISGTPPMSVDSNLLDWAAMDWGYGSVYPGVWDRNFEVGNL
jgi:Fungal specific transcription factor domain